MKFRKLFARKMPKSINVSVSFHNNVNRPPTMDDIRQSFVHILVKNLGEIGAGQYVWSVSPESVVIEEKKTVRFVIDLHAPKAKTEISRFIASLSLVRAIGTDKVAVRIVD
jgi:RNase P/RNase MRP subunit POP5